MNPKAGLQLPNDIEGLMLYGFPWFFVLGIIAATIIVMVGMFLLWRRHRQKKLQTPTEPPRDPLKEALAELAKLKLSDPWLQKQAGDFCFAASFAFRQVLECVIDLRATDMTVGEIRRAIGAFNLPAAVSASELIKALERADLVKFADQTISLEAAQRWRQQLLSWGRSLSEWHAAQLVAAAELAKKAPKISEDSAGGVI